MKLRDPRLVILFSFLSYYLTCTTHNMAITIITAANRQIKSLNQIDNTLNSALNILSLKILIVQLECFIFMLCRQYNKLHLLINYRYCGCHNILLDTFGFVYWQQRKCGKNSNFESRQHKLYLSGSGRTISKFKFKHETKKMKDENVSFVCLFELQTQ